MWWVLLCCEVLACFIWMPFVFGLPGKASPRGELFCSTCSPLHVGCTQGIGLRQGAAALAPCLFLFLHYLAFRSS